MNILFSCGDYYPNLGGAQSLVDDLARALLRMRHSVSVLTRQHAGMPATEIYHGYEIQRIEYPLLYEKFEWNKALSGPSLDALRQIRDRIRTHKIDTVCIGLLDMSAWYLFVLRQMMPFRLVLYLHGGETRALPAFEPTYAKLLRMGLRVADTIVAVSEELRVEAARHWPAALPKTRVILNAIDMQDIRAARPWSHAREYIGAVGRLVPEKDFGTLIRAYGQVQNEIGGVDLILAGEGKQGAALRTIARDCAPPERVIFLGRVEREAALAVMKGARFLAMPSVTEGFPIVALEALALGRPILGSAIPGIQAIVQEGRHGSLFPPGDIAALAGLIRTYCNDAAYFQSVREAVELANLEQYDIAHVAARHVEAYAGIR